MLLVISFSTDDKRSPIWLKVLRLIIKAGDVTIYVLATSVFASVALVALPMAQMLLMVIMGSGVFSRAIASGLVTAAHEELPLIHLITEDEATGDYLMLKVMKMQSEDTSISYLLEMDGKLWSCPRYIGNTNPWARRLFGFFAGRPSI
jgi:hypothetical protein